MTMQHPSHHLWPPNLWSEVGDLTFDDEIRGRVDRARQLRAEAVAEGIVAAYDGLAHALRASAAWLARRRRAAQTRHALEQCSDRTLADIGIRREDIALVAREPGARSSVRRLRAAPERPHSDDRPDTRAGRPEMPRAA